jgi:hypothetical protein
MTASDDETAEVRRMLDMLLDYNRLLAEEYALAMQEARTKLAARLPEFALIQTEARLETSSAA